MTASKTASGTTATVTVTSTRFNAQFSLLDLTAKYLKDNYLTGFVFTGANGDELPPAFFEEKIAMAISKLEDITHIDILERTVCGEKHDYIVTDYLSFAFMQLNRVPAQSVSEVRAVYPTGQIVQVYPSEWVRLQVEHSQFHLVPTSGTLANVMMGAGAGAGYLTFIFGATSYLPQLWEIDYKSGFAENAVPREIVSVICKLASIDILLLMSDLIGPLGIASSSLGIDGMSQSISRQLPAFKARIDQYRMDLGLPGPGSDGKYGSGEIGQIRRTYLGMVMTSV